MWGRSRWGGNDQFKDRATPWSNTNTEEPIEPPTEPTHNAAEPPIEPPIESTLNDAEPTHNSSEPTVNVADGDEPPEHNVNEYEVESDVESSESEEDVLPEEDDSDVDDELRSLRVERRSKRQGKQRKKPIATDEIPLGEAGIDRGFEDIGRNKTSRYVGKLGGDEQFIDSSEADSEDSTEGLDPEAIPGVDIPAKMRSTKVRYDPNCEVAIFELGMIFENAI
ncbi:chitin biosynthesis protein CHS5-like [Nicotiana sylvestris]|uniref:chitin biosynthesis protein CHS5-like n=1 Tax=Nicotiana sylvestris TaxID=4096 RepID=UPI00388C3B96